MISDEPRPSFDAEDLHRLGLAGGARFRVPRLRLGCDAALQVLKGLRPPWPRLARTLLVAVVLWTFNFGLWVAIRCLSSGWPTLPVGSAVQMPTAWQSFLRSVVDPFQYPLPFLRTLGTLPFWAGSSPFALVPGVWLTLKARTPGLRSLGIFFLAAALSTVAWGVAGKPASAGFFSLGVRLFPVVPVVVAAAATAAFLLLRAGSEPATAVTYLRAFPALCLTVLLAVNLSLLLADPGTVLLSKPTGIPAWYQKLEGVTFYSELIGFLLLLVPALVVSEGLGFLQALRLLLRTVVRRPLALPTALIVVAVLGWLPIADAAHAALTALGRRPFLSIGGTLAVAPFQGLGAGIVLYATIRIAHVLCKQDRDECVVG